MSDQYRILCMSLRCTPCRLKPALSKSVVQQVAAARAQDAEIAGLDVNITENKLGLFKVRSRAYVLQNLAPMSTSNRSTAYSLYYRALQAYCAANMPRGNHVVRGL